jgi:hypothetical protein
MRDRCAWRGLIGKALGLALIAALVVPIASSPVRADQFRGGHFVGRPFFRGPVFSHDRFFFRDHRFFVRDRVFVGPFFGPPFVSRPVVVVPRPRVVIYP